MHVRSGDEEGGSLGEPLNSHNTTSNPLTHDSALGHDPDRGGAPEWLLCTRHGQADERSKYHSPLGTYTMFCSIPIFVCALRTTSENRSRG